MTDLLDPGTSFAGYQIESVAGRGGMGVVYAAQQLRPNRRVALKVIAPHLAQDPEFRRRFERESETAAAIEHPNVIPVYEVGEAEDQLFITMRFVEGTDLRALFNTRGGIDPVEASGLITQVAGALDAAHERGLVHRDIKPANVLIAGREGAWHAYLTDFGLTKDVSAESVTSSGMVVGTLDYIAPEQLYGHAVDGRADVYALGCVLYESLTGQVPYPRDSVVALMYAHGNEPPPQPCAVKPSLPAEFDNVVARAMAKDPDERYQSAGDLARAAAAAARDERPSERERSVARGAAAPTVAPPPQTVQGPPPPAAPASAPAPPSPPSEPPPPAAGPPSPLSEPPAAVPGFRAPVASTPAAHPATAARPPKSRRGLIVAGAVLAAVIAVAVVVALVAGGGGDDGGGGDTGGPTAVSDPAVTTDAEAGPMTDEEYDAAASEIASSVDATHAEERFREALPTDQAERDQVAAEMSHVSTAYSTAGDQYDLLRPPEGAEDVHGRARDLIRELGTVVSEGRIAADANDQDAWDTAAARYGTTRDQIGEIDDEYAQLGFDMLSSFNPGGT